MKKVLSLTCAVAVLLCLGGIAQARAARSPANDDQGAAAVVTALPFTESANLASATLEVDEAQPSCGPITGSIWYAVSTSTENNLLAELSATSRSVVAIFESTSQGVTEVGCALANRPEPLEVNAAADTSYLIQVGAASKKPGVVDLGLRLSDWVEETIVEQNFRRESEEQHVPLVSVKAGPRESAPSIYDVRVGISEQEPVTLGVLTFGLITQRLEAELLRVPASTTDVSVRISGRYDSSQYTCAADNGSETCYAAAPLTDLGWLTGGDASRAELVVTVSAARNGEVLQERTVTAPYAGQPMGLIP